MAVIESIKISGDQIHFVNKGKGSSLFITIDLERFWESIKDYSWVYIVVWMRIPVIENSLSMVIEISLERNYEIQSLGAIHKATMEGEVPGRLDEVHRDKMEGKAKLTGYNCSIR